MTIQRGTPSNRRIHAKNFTQSSAQKRLDEVVPTYQRQGLNALGVDNHPVYLYLKQMSSTACTCREVQSGSELGAAPSARAIMSGINEEHEITIDWSKPLFGEPNEARFEEEQGGGDNDDYAFDDGDVPHANQILESSPDCGICYRSGFLPGFEQYGKKRYVFTTLHVVDQSGYNIDRSLAPHEFNRLHPRGFVEFEMLVPKYFKSASFSVRHNHSLLGEVLYVAPNVPCSLAYLKMAAGTTIRIRVIAEAFTHAVVTFDLGTEEVVANIAQLSKQTDWTTFETVGNLNVILPMMVKEVTVGSLLWLPKKSIGLRIVDVTYLRTSGSHNLDWSVNTRIAQPQEAWKFIAKSFPIL